MVEVTKELCDAIRCGRVTFEQAGWETVYACSQLGYIGAWSCPPPPATAPPVILDPWTQAVTAYKAAQSPQASLTAPDPCGHIPFEPEPPCEPKSGLVSVYQTPVDYKTTLSGSAIEAEMACADNLATIEKESLRLRRLNLILWWLVVLIAIYHVWSKRK